MSESNQVVAAVSVRLPNVVDPSHASGIRPGELIKAGQVVPSDAPLDWVERSIAAGHLRVEALDAPEPVPGTPPSVRRSDAQNVDAGRIDPEAGIDSNLGDPALRERLARVADQQEEAAGGELASAEDQQAAQSEDVNLETGEVTIEGGEPSMDDVAGEGDSEAQVS